VRWARNHGSGSKRCCCKMLTEGDVLQA
jgi:hypothetical protein